MDVNVDANKVADMVRSTFGPDAGDEVIVDGAGANYTITVISDSFAGKRPVARQQAVYAVLNEAIAGGAIHAVNLHTFTREEWQAAQG